MQAALSKKKYILKGVQKKNILGKILSSKNLGSEASKDIYSIKFVEPKYSKNISSLHEGFLQTPFRYGAAKPNQ